MGRRPGTTGNDAPGRTPALLGAILMIALARSAWAEDRAAAPLPKGAIGRLGPPRAGRDGGEADERPLRSLAISPSGSTIVVGCDHHEGGATAFDVATGRQLWRWEETGVECLAFSPDGKTVAAGTAYDGGRLALL